MPASDRNPRHGLSAVRRVPCIRSRSGAAAGRKDSDTVAVEEPLELRVAGVPVATLMRTPGSDRHLALGFYLSEGWIEGIEDVGALVFCGRSGREDNVVDLVPARGARTRRPSDLPRLSPAVSSCGVCGKRTIDEVFAQSPLARRAPKVPARPKHHRLLLLDPRVVVGLPAALRAAQGIFEATGAIHAAGLFDSSGRVDGVEEDVGRHNAVDKTIGRALIARSPPLAGRGLVVSGRVSFEIVQKAYRAKLGAIVAVSGVTSLALDLALRAGIAVAGFVRGDTFTIYTPRSAASPPRSRRQPRRPSASRRG